jgi:hypothetical protein
LVADEPVAVAAFIMPRPLGVAALAGLVMGLVIKAAKLIAAAIVQILHQDMEPSPLGSLSIE